MLASLKQEPLMIIKTKFNSITFNLLEYLDACDKLWFLQLLKALMLVKNYMGRSIIYVDIVQGCL